MAKRKHSELAAGAFVILALAAGVGALLWLGAGDFLTPAKARAVFWVARSAGSVGLIEGSLVQVNDAVVGKIASIRYDPAGKTLYVAEIDRADLAIHSDGKAHVAAGLVGAGALVVTDLGSAEKPLADAEHAVEISRGLSQAIRDLAGAVDAVREEFDLTKEEALLAKVHRTIDKVESIAGSLQAEMDLKDADSIRSKVRATAGHTEEMAAGAKEMIKTARPDVEGTVASIRGYTEKDLADILTKFRKASTELVTIAANLRSVSATSKDIIVLNRRQIEDTLTNLKSMSSNLNAAAKEIRRNPWRLLHRPGEQERRSEDIYDAARAFAEGAGQLNDALTRLAALHEARPQGVTADDPELKKIRTYVETSFEKFRKVEDALWKELTR